MIIKCWTVWKATTAAAKPAVAAVAKVVTGIRRVRHIRRAAVGASLMVPTIVCTVVGLAGLPGDAAQIGGTNGIAHTSASGYRDDVQLDRAHSPGVARVDRPLTQGLIVEDASMTTSHGYHDTGMAIISGHQPHDAGTTTHHPTLDTQPHVTAVPEPSSFIILGTALAIGLLFGEFARRA